MCLEIVCFCAWVNGVQLRELKKDRVGNIIMIININNINRQDGLHSQNYVYDFSPYESQKKTVHNSQMFIKSIFFVLSPQKTNKRMETPQKL